MTLVVTHPYVSTITETTPSGGPGGTVGPTEWNANHTLTGVASPAQGGTGITSGTGVTFFSSATVLADSGTLPLNQVLLGGGANASPTFVSTLGSTLQVLYGGSPPQWGTAATTTGSTGGGGSVGGSSGSVQFSTGGTFGGDTNFTYTPGGQVAINLSSSTSTAGISGLSIVTSSSSDMASNASALKITGTWNSSGTTYDAPLFMNIVNTASAVGSFLADFQVSGVSATRFGPGSTLNDTNYAIDIYTGIPGFGGPFIGSSSRKNGIGSNDNIGGTDIYGNNTASGTAVINVQGEAHNNSGGNVNLGAWVTLGWVSGAQNTVTADFFLWREGSKLLSLGAGTSATGFRVYNTVDTNPPFSAPTNYERGVFDWTTTANTLTIATQAGGTGTARNIQINPAGGTTQFGTTGNANAVAVFGNSTVTIDGGNALIKVHGSNSAYMAGSAVASFFAPSGTVYGFSNTATPSSPSDGLDTGLSRVAAKVVQVGDGATNANGWMQWAGQTRVSSNVTSSSTTLANVTGLSVTLQSSRTYSFEAYLFFTDLAAAGIQAAINTTTTSTGYTLTIDGFVIDGSGTFATRGFARATTMGAPVASTLTTGTLGQAVLRGTLTTSSAITANIQFSQIVPNATQTIINTGSYMLVHDMP